MPLLIGCLSAILTRLLGSGGAVLTVTLLLVAGAEPRVAVGTAVAYTLVMGGRGTWAHLRRPPSPNSAGAPVPGLGMAGGSLLGRARGLLGACRPALHKVRQDPRAVARTPGFAAGVGALAGVLFAEVIGSTPLAILLAMGAFGLAWLELWPSLSAVLGERRFGERRFVARRGAPALDGAGPDIEVDLVDAERRRVAAAVGVTAVGVTAVGVTAVGVTAVGVTAVGATTPEVVSTGRIDVPPQAAPADHSSEVASGAPGGGLQPGLGAPGVSPVVVVPGRPTFPFGSLAGKGANGLAVMAGSLGMLRGATGIGGAAVLLPWAGRHLGLTRRAAAEGLLTAVLVGSATASVLHLLAGNIDGIGLVLLLLGGGLGSLASSCVMRPIPDGIRSRVLGGVLAACAVLLLLRAF